jgi:hypothetical protein
MRVRFRVGSAVPTSGESLMLDGVEASTHACGGHYGPGSALCCRSVSGRLRVRRGASLRWPAGYEIQTSSFRIRLEVMRK